MLPIVQCLHDLIELGLIAVGMETGLSCIDFKMLQQSACVARVFGGDEIRFFERTDGPESDVLEVADWG